MDADNLHAHCMHLDDAGRKNSGLFWPKTCVDRGSLCIGVCLLLDCVFTEFFNDSSWQSNNGIRSICSSGKRDSNDGL